MAKKVRKQDVSKLVGILHSISSQTSQVTNQIQSILKQIQDGDISTNKGISFLEVKYQMMLSYLTNLTYLMLQKVKGQPLNGDPAIERIVEARTVIEKMRPIDHKLRYQVDKLVKVATTGITSENDPLHFKPNPDNLISKLDEEDEESSEEEEEKKGKKDDKPRKYVPPRVAAMHYDGDETVQDRQQRALQKAKKRALSSSLMQELRAEYNDAPDEILETTNVHKIREDREAKHKIEYEEEHFVRLPITRKERQAQRRVMTESSLKSLARFDDISILGHEEGSAVPLKKRKKMPSKLRKGKKKSSRKKWK
ncbi:neuroguidin-like [Amphiura filiformis]|uniref:neuroguidin-like n=1 Tax=Amphiura filiformis TaxID=82378 RepID=UPI003B20BFBA